MASELSPLSIQSPMSALSLLSPGEIGFTKEQSSQFLSPLDEMLSPGEVQPRIPKENTEADIFPLVFSFLENVRRL